MKISIISELLYLFFIRIPFSILGFIRGNLIFVHWGRGLNNFGDCLQPDILRCYGFTPVYVPQRRSDVVLAGSILQWVPSDYKGIILGTGGGEQNYDFPNAYIVGVRGELSLSRLKQESVIGVVGDPGLIMNKVFPDKVDKTNQLGVIPHFVDKDHVILRQWAARFGKDSLLIDVLRNPRDVIHDIKSCEYIVSSSLHGLIIADAFDIPNARFVIRETMPTEFYDYKFKDYYSSLLSEDMPLEAEGSETLDDLINMTRLHSQEVRVLQDRLDRALSSLSGLIKQRRRR